MITKTPNTRKKFRRFKRQMQLIKALDDITPNKQVGKWADLHQAFTESKSRERQQLGELTMPRNMSFMLTTAQMLNKTKTQTRRLGWWNLKPNEILNAVEKCQGLKKGQKMIKIGKILVTERRIEKLSAITQADVIAEGFPDLTPAQFVDMFCLANKCAPNVIVNVITFVHK